MPLSLSCWPIAPPREPPLLQEKVQWRTCISGVLRTHDLFARTQPANQGYPLGTREQNQTQLRLPNQPVMGWFNGGKFCVAPLGGTGLEILTLGPVSRVRGCCPFGETTQGTSQEGIRLWRHIALRTPTPEATCFSQATPLLAHTPDTSTDLECQPVANDNAALLL